MIIKPTIYTTRYASPLGALLLAADKTGLIGVWFEGQKHFGETLIGDIVPEKNHAICQAETWLDTYFSGKEPDFTPEIHMIGSEFRKQVWHLLLKISYGQTMSYGDIARKMAAEKSMPQISAQAVGGAVGHNPISIIVPCHRVIGANGNLTGYAGGIARKSKLLALEHCDQL